ncbi:MAG: 30S ribosomal protein S12 methylthiotransferase RimO [bacterium]
MSAPSQPREPRAAVYLMTLGCAKNQVDSEVTAARLLGDGFSFVAAPDEADVILLNTCAFIQDAVQENLAAIRRFARYRRQGRCRCLAVAGCLVQRLGTTLLQQVPEVDLLVKIPAMGRIGPVLHEYLHEGGTRRILHRPPRHPRALRVAGERVQRLAPGPWAYLKIAEGCSNRCSYCTLPGIRGPLRSRSSAEITEEAARLAEQGVLELNLVAQDLAAYGRERGASSSRPLARLLSALQRIDAVRWIRLLYCHPSHVDENLVCAMAELEKLCPYLDLPIQHVAPRILKAMRRPYTEDDLLRLIERLRRARPDLALRTTVMVGFPGETEREFESLTRFLRLVRFHHVGAFCYSPEPGTDASRLPAPVPRRVAEERFRKVFKVQSRISREIQKRYVGTVQQVLVEGALTESRAATGSGYSLKARTRYQSPEVDGHVCLRRTPPAAAGSLLDVRITGARTYDLLAEPLEPEGPARARKAGKSICR